MNLGEKILETIRNKNYSVKPEHLIRQAYCEWHKTRKKQWILDLDNDSMTEYKLGEIVFGGPRKIIEKTWTRDEVIELVKTELREIGKDENELYVVPTRNGCHVITSPFNLQSAFKKCGLMFEGVQKVKTGYRQWDTKPGEPGYVGSIGLDHHFESITKEITGWLHKDGMSLLYMNLKD